MLGSFYRVALVLAVGSLGGCTEDPDDDGEGAGGAIVVDADGAVDEDAGGIQVLDPPDMGMPWCTPDEFEDQVIAYCEAQFAPGRIGANCNADAQCDSGYCYANAICTLRCGADRPACPPQTQCSPAADEAATFGCVPSDGRRCEHWSGSLTDCIRNVNMQLIHVCSPDAEEDCADKARAYLACLGELGQICPESEFDECAAELVRTETCCDNCAGPF